MPTTCLPQTRHEASLGCLGKVLKVHAIWTGVQISDRRLAVIVTPNGDGRLMLRLVGYPRLTGLREPCSLLDTEARYYRPEDIALADDRLVCLVPSARAPALRQGFTLALDPAMAQMVAAWLPRLARVAELTQQLHELVAALMAPPPSASVMNECAQLIAKLLLDREPIKAAIAAALRDLHSERNPLLLSALAAPTVVGLLYEIEDEARRGRLSATAGVGGQAGQTRA